MGLTVLAELLVVIFRVVKPVNKSVGLACSPDLVSELVKISCGLPAYMNMTLLGCRMGLIVL